MGPIYWNVDKMYSLVNLISGGFTISDLLLVGLSAKY